MGSVWGSYVRRRRGRRCGIGSIFVGKGPKKKEEKDLSANTTEGTVREKSEQERDETENASDDQGRPSEMLKPVTTEVREQKQAIRKLPNLWERNHDTSEKTESSKLGGQEGQTAIQLEDLASKIRCFNEKHWSSSGNEVTCSYCMKRMPKKSKYPLTWPSTSNNPNEVCAACHLPILEGNTDEANHCPRCKIFLHKFCVKYPPEIHHPLHPLHPLTLENPERIGNNIKCNVYGDKCRGRAYYSYQGCKFYLEVQCLFREPTFQSKCYGKIFCLQEKPTINQNPRGCFACGKKIITGSSSIDFLRCVPCNVNLHVQCPIPSPIIRSFHPHPLFFNGYCFGHDCKFCKKELKRLYPAYSCEVCGDDFHLECSTTN